MKAITVNQLMKACSKQVQKGNGNKQILITSDDEGNELHELFQCFDEDFAKNVESYRLPYGVTKENIKNYITLG